MSAISRVRLPRLARPRLRPPRPRTLLSLVLVIMVLGGGWLWVRGSSLVSVDRVTVTGLRGPSSGQIRSALLSAARNMTTLEVNMSALQVAVAPFPVVKGVEVSTQFPHGMRIRVLEQVAVGAVSVDGRRIPVAANGTLLPSVSASGLPSIPVSVPPGGTRLTSRSARGAVAVLAAAPGWLRARVTQVSSTAANGLVAELHNGPEIYFGDASQLRAKWTAAAAVLADPGSEGAVYIDVSVPERPAVGGVAGAAGSDQSATAATATTPDSTSAGVAGTTGNTGVPATEGNTGVPGTAGTTGAAGTNGNTGVVGSTGNTGAGNAPAPATTGTG